MSQYVIVSIYGIALARARYNKDRYAEYAHTSKYNQRKDFAIFSNYEGYYKIYLF